MYTPASMVFPIAESVLAIAQAYASAGVLVALAFLLFGLDRVDPAARTSYIFRALIFPGLVLIWPVVVWRWRHAGTAPSRPPLPVSRHVALHSVVWFSLALLVPILLGAAFVQGRASLPDRPSVRLGVAP